MLAYSLLFGAGATCCLILLNEIDDGQALATISLAHHICFVVVVAHLCDIFLSRGRGSGIGNGDSIELGRGI